MEGSKEHGRNKFTFHNVSINSTTGKFPPTPADIYLHSIMYLLIRISRADCLRGNINLHSIMYLLIQGVE